MQKQNIDLSTLSAAELEQLLNEKKAADIAEKQAKRSHYESERDVMINALCDSAVMVSAQLTELKSFAFQELSSFRENMLEYGDLKGGVKNKGSFSIQNEKYKIEFKNQIRKAFDERAELAESKLRTFLNTFLKKKAHKDVVDIITSILERNTKTNEYDINLISRLYAMKDRFSDPNWKEAIELFQESYSPTGTAQYVRFFQKNTASGWDGINLDLASAKLPVTDEEAQ